MQGLHECGVTLYNQAYSYHQAKPLLWTCAPTILAAAGGALTLEGSTSICQPQETILRQLFLI